MKKNLGVKSYLLPMPVLIIATYNEDGSTDAMNAAWGTLCESNQVALFLSAEHRTVQNIKERKAFTVSIADVANLVAADYVGVVSLNDDPDKMKKSGLHFTKSQFVDAPTIDEFPLVLECELAYIDEKMECVVGTILNVGVEEGILTKDKIDFQKLSPISYNPIDHTYVKVTEPVGRAFHDGLKLK